MPRAFNFYNINCMIDRVTKFLEAWQINLTWWPDLMWPGIKHFTHDVKYMYHKQDEVSWRCSPRLSFCTQTTVSGLTNRSSVGRALDSVWWEHTFRLEKSLVRGATDAWCLWAFWWIWLRLVAGRSHAKSARGPAVRGYVRTVVTLCMLLQRLSSLLP